MSGHVGFVHTFSELKTYPQHHAFGHVAQFWDGRAATLAADRGVTVSSARPPVNLVAGTVTVPASRIEMMYDPARFGLSPSQTLTTEPSPDEAVAGR